VPPDRARSGAPRRSRARALGFAALALAAAGLAAAITNGYGARVAGSFGPLRRVVVTKRALPPGRPLAPDDLAALDVRRVPERFVPVGSLREPAAALGLAPRVRLPAGSYVAGSLLAPPQRRRPAVPGLVPGLRPVEITVGGAAALEAAGPLPSGSTVDVVVTSEPRGTGPGRTYVAAAGVPLIGLGPGPDGPGPAASASAILGLTRAQALRLISAESFARQIRLLPASPGRNQSAATASSKARRARPP
jgi:Flp pilus assembly protein CpaB